MTVRQREDAGGLVKGTAHVNTSASNYGHILNGHTLTCKYLRIGVDSTPVWASGRGTYGSREAELTPSPPLRQEHPRFIWHAVYSVLPQESRTEKIRFATTALLI